MKHWIILTIASLLYLGCGNYNIFAPKGATNSNVIDQANNELQSGHPTAAVGLLLTQLPQKSQTLIHNFSSTDTNFTTNLKNSLQGVDNAKSIVTLLATALVRTAGVDVLDIAAKVLKIEDSTSLALTACASQSIAQYLPIVEDLNIDFNNVGAFINTLLEGYVMWGIYDEPAEQNLQLLMVMIDFVITMSEIKSLDINDDNKISPAEASAITPGLGQFTYSMLQITQDDLTEYNRLSNNSLNKTVSKVNGYISDIGVKSGDSNETIALKLQTYLVAKTDC